MRNYRRLILLSVFVAAGVGLAISLGSSMPSSDPTHTARDARPNDTGSNGPEAFAPSSLSASVPSPMSLTSSPVLDSQAAASPSGTDPVYTQPYPALAQNSSGTGPVLATPEQIQEQIQRQKKALGNSSSKTDSPAPSSTTTSQPSAQDSTATTQPSQAQSQSSQPTNVQPQQSYRNSVRRTHDSRGDHFAINILDSDIREVLDLLSKEGGLNILASPKVRGKVSASLNNVKLEEALDAILKSTGYIARREGSFIFVGSPEDFTQMAHTTDRIDTRIYHPSYITSAELKNIITPILTQGVGVISVTSESSSGIPANMTDAGGDNYAGGDALLVRDYEAVLCEVDQLVAEVDLRPLQVHIEAMVLSVKLDDKNKFGVDFQLLRQFSNLKFGWGNVPASLGDIKFDGGLKFGFLDSTLGSFINALEEVGDTNVIATPRLMVVNKHAAEIQIGKSIGYVNTTQTETAATQTVEFLELGTLLRIRPFVSNDGMIRMEVHPEVSDGDVDVEQGFTLPYKEVTQVTTNILIRDGCTAVIGGLLQNEQKVDRSQVPLFGSLPVVGVAFRDSEEDTSRHELIVLITPNIVREKTAYREGAIQGCEFQRRQSTYAEKMNPLSKRFIARKYVRRARQAWAEGKRHRALRLAELAVHFDPVNREAIELRSDIWLGKPYIPGCEKFSNEMPPEALLDSPRLPPWLLQQLGGPAGYLRPHNLEPCPESTVVPTETPGAVETIPLPVPVENQSGRTPTAPHSQTPSGASSSTLTMLSPPQSSQTTTRASGPTLYNPTSDQTAPPGITEAYSPLP